MTQKDKIYNHLLKHGKITAWEAIQKYRITRLSQYIYMMRKEGKQIDGYTMSKKNEDGNVMHWTEYRLKEDINAGKQEILLD